MQGRNSCIRLIGEIIEDIDNLPQGPFWVRDVILEKRYSFPVTLDVGNGRSIDIRPGIDQKLSTFSTALADTYFEAKNRISKILNGERW